MFSKKEITLEFTVERCDSCNKEQKRKFKEGDFLFSKNSKCDSCGGNFFIEKIFGEKQKQ